MRVEEVGGPEDGEGEDWVEEDVATGYGTCSTAGLGHGGVVGETNHCSIGGGRGCWRWHSRFAILT